MDLVEHVTTPDLRGPLALYQLDDHTPQLVDPASIWVAENASVVGNVALAAFSSIWFGAVLRGDNETIRIGERTNVQDNVTIHSDPGSPCTIGNDVTIGHDAIVHGCTVSDGCLIGMGATILNNAHLGKNCLVGANTLIPEGKEFPDRSLIVGSPGKAIRVLDDEAVAALIDTARRYVINANRFKAGLQKLTPET